MRPVPNPSLQGLPKKLGRKTKVSKIFGLSEFRGVVGVRILDKRFLNTTSVKTPTFPHMLFTFLLLRRWGGENWELMQYSSFITKFTDTAHLRDQIQVWRKILRKFWENRGEEVERRTNLICSCGSLHSHKTYFTRSELVVNLDWIRLTFNKSG